MVKAPVVPFSLAVVRMVAVVATIKRAGLLIMAYYLMKRWNNRSSKAAGAAGGRRQHPV